MSQARDIEDEMNETLKNVIRDININLVAELQENTPVDTSWARANWWTHLGGNVLQEPAPNTFESAALSNAQNEQTRTVDTLLNYELAQGQVTVYNNVPYINVLNDRHSEKAGFVPDAINKTLQDLES